MTTHTAWRTWLTIALLMASVWNATPLDAAEAKADPQVQKICDQMLKAIEDQDREAFIAHGTEAVKEGTTDAIMESIHKTIGGRMAAGFELEFLTSLKQQGHEIYLWKLSFKEGDDLIVRMAMKDGKVAGFFLQ